jgi:superfamily II DNA/RNA helicase
MMTFDELNLNKPLLNALADLNFTHPTTIQRKSFAVIMSGRDIVYSPDGYRQDFVISAACPASVGV